MHVGAKFEDIENMKITVVCTGTVAEFNKLIAAIDRKYQPPMNKFVEAIKNQINKSVIQVATDTVNA